MSSPPKNSSGLVKLQMVGNLVQFALFGGRVATSVQDEPVGCIWIVCLWSGFEGVERCKVTECPEDTGPQGG